MVEEIASLKADNARLNQIISVLLEQIAILKQSGPVSNTVNGNSESAITTSNNQNGNSKSTVATLYNQNGNNKSAITTLDIQNGNSESAIASLNVQTGNTEAAEGIIKLTPAYIDVNESNASKMVYRIKRQFHVRVFWKSLRAIGRELLYIHNKGFASAKELEPLSGLTHSGFTKHIILLRQRGLLKRESYQKFILTDISKQILNETFAR